MLLKLTFSFSVYAEEVEDEKLLFNKIILELKLKRFKKAKEDIEKLLLYEDIDNSIMNDILYLQELYKNELK